MLPVHILQSIRPELAAATIVAAAIAIAAAAIAATAIAKAIAVQ